MDSATKPISTHYSKRQSCNLRREQNQADQNCEYNRKDCALCAHDSGPHRGIHELCNAFEKKYLVTFLAAALWLLWKMSWTVISWRKWTSDGVTSKFWLQTWCWSVRPSGLFRKPRMMTISYQKVRGPPTWMMSGCSRQIWRSYRISSNRRATL